MTEQTEAGPVLGEDVVRRAALAAFPGLPEGMAVEEAERRVAAALAAVVPDLVAQARAAREQAGAARVWGECARQYEHTEKMPRWDQDKAVVTNGWTDGRCGNCGEALPGATP